MSVSRLIKSLATGPFSASYWENEVQLGDGTTRPMKSVSFQHCYYSKKEKALVRQTVTINPVEIGSVIRLLQRMQEEVIEERGGKMDGNGADLQPTDASDAVPF